MQENVGKEQSSDYPESLLQRILKSEWSRYFLSQDVVYLVVRHRGHRFWQWQPERTTAVSKFESLMCFISWWMFLSCRKKLEICPYERVEQEGMKDLGCKIPGIAEASRDRFDPLIFSRTLGGGSLREFLETFEGCCKAFTITTRCLKWILFA